LADDAGPVPQALQCKHLLRKHGSAAYCGQGIGRK
jgi:hypothetical protein